VQGQGGLAEAIRRHGEVYRNAESYQTMFAGIQPLVQTLLAPLWHWHVPAVFVGVPLLFVFRDARGLALAALPHVLFILFGARHKDPPYFAPEMTLYLASIVTWATAAAIWVVKRIPSRIAPVSIIAICMAGLTLATLREKPASSGYLVRFTRNLTDMDLARAAGLDIAGPNAFIGSTSLGVWYTAGAAHFYNVGPEVLNGPSVSIKPKIFFSRFDGLALDQHRSWVTSNKERIGLTSFYLSGDLHIKGFWFDDRRSAGESQLSWVMYSASSVPVRGYATRGGRMYRFDQAPDGDYTLFSAVCDRTRLPNSGQFDDYLTLYFPLANNDDPRWGLGPRPVIRTLLVSKAQFRKDVLPAAASCKVRDEIPGRIVEVDPNVMLSNLHASDQVIRFYRSFPTALAGSQRLTPTNTVKIPGVVSLADIRNLYSKVILTRRGTAYYLKTTPVLWFDDAAIPIRHRPNIGGGFLHLTGKVLKGVVGISMRGHDPFALIGSEAVWGERDGLNDTYVPVTSFDTLERVVIRNQSQDGESEMLIQDVAAVTEKPPS